MKFLADESLELGVVRVLREKGHDVRAVAEETPRASDREVLGKAAADRRILITNDKDFAELTFLKQEAAHGIILLRMPRLGTTGKAQRVLEALQPDEPALRNSMTVVEEHATRRRRMPSASD